MCKGTGGAALSEIVLTFKNSSLSFCLSLISVHPSERVCVPTTRWERDHLRRLDVCQSTRSGKTHPRVLHEVAGEVAMHSV